MAILLSAPFYTGRRPLVTWLLTARKAIMTRNFDCRRPATKAKYSVNNVFGSLLYTASESLDTQLPNSNYIRPGIHATDPHSQVSKKETFCPGQREKTRPFLQPDLSPAPGQLMHIHMHSPSPAVKRGISRLCAK